MRITIIGLPGSGKTTLARRICEKFNIPHLHLDRLWFESGGHRISRNDEEAKNRVREYIHQHVLPLIEQESWVSDGWYSRVQPLISDRAEYIVYLDIPFWRRVLNHYTRVFTRKSHTEISFWQDIIFIFGMIRRIWAHGPQIRRFMKENKDKVITLRSRREINQFFNNL